MRNFRDLGGITSQDGRSVKHGLFFRSGHLNNLSDKDIKKLKDINVKHIFDYRSDEEALDKPSIEIENVKNIRITAMKMPDKNSIKFNSVEEMIKQLFDNEVAFNMLKKSYYDLPINNKSYKELINLIKEPNNLPILTHCSAGKDRTGVGSAIILMILGVSRENIMKDYLISNTHAHEVIQDVIKNQPEFKSVDESKLNYIFGVNEDYINETFRNIDENYKDDYEYLSKEFDLSKEEINRLRDLYLER